MSRAAYFAAYRRDRAAGIRRTVPATGTHRKIQSLMAAGWSGPRQAALVGRSEQWVKAVLRSRRVTPVTESAVDRLFQRLRGLDAPRRTAAESYSAGRAIRAAKENGWPRPEAWLDVDINNPASRPRTRRLEGTGRAA